MTESNVAENEFSRDERSDDRAPGEEVAGEPAEQLRQAEEKALRAQAELENFRKRARRELDEERRYAVLPLLADLLPVLDNLDRAIGAAEIDESAAGLLEGVKMVSAQLRGVLEQNECRRIKDLGESFDPNLHEAIGQEPSTEYAAGQVSRVTRQGYVLHDRVVRPSQVMISTGSEASRDPETGGVTPPE